MRIEQDFGAWIGFQISKELPNNFKLSLDQQIRTWKNSTRIDKYFADLGLKYKINKNFSLAGGIRYTHDTNKWEEPENGFRYNVDLRFKTIVVKKFRLVYRARYQQLLTLKNRAALTPNVVTVTRHRLKGQWKAHKKHELYTGAELFVRREALRTSYLDRLRFSLGDKIKTKIGQFDVGVGYEVNLQRLDPFSFFFVKTIYNISF